MSDYQDLIVTSEGGVATVAINRPKVLNAMRAETVEELIRAIDGAGWDKSIGVIVLTGTGNRPFAPAATRAPMKANTTAAAPSACRSRRCKSLIRDVPKPVIARVHGYAIGGGNVLATICDLTIAGESARVRPGRPEGRLGRSGLRHRLSRARGRREESARDLVFVPPLHRDRRRSPWAWSTPWCPTTSSTPKSRNGAREIMERSPTAIAIAKRSFNADTESIRALSWMGMQTLSFYYDTEESREGVRAFLEKRKPEFRKHVR